jgi:chaperonin cofactor prefoldin
VVVVLAQDVSRLLPPASTTESSKTASLTRAIEKLSSRQDSIEKKSRALNEQIVTIRKNINQRIQQDKKDQS